MQCEVNSMNIVSALILISIVLIYFFVLLLRASSCIVNFKFCVTFVANKQFVYLFIFTVGKNHIKRNCFKSKSLKNYSKSKSRSITLTSYPHNMGPSFMHLHLFTPHYAPHKCCTLFATKCSRKFLCYGNMTFYRFIYVIIIIVG